MAPPRCIDARLDVLGLFCPEPIGRLQLFTADRPAGQVIEMVGDDGGLQWDLPAWCLSHGHELIELREEPGGIWRGWVRLISRGEFPESSPTRSD